MTTRLKYLQSLTVTLLILIMSAGTALPSGIHLELCFGSDGHLGLKTDACLPETIPLPRTGYEFSSDHDHPENCLDLAVGCGSSEQIFFCRDYGGKIKKKICTHPRGTDTCSPPASPRFPIPGTTHLLFPGLKWLKPAPHLTYLRTIVLLI